MLQSLGIICVSPKFRRDPAAPFPAHRLPRHLPRCHVPAVGAGVAGQATRDDGEPLGAAGLLAGGRGRSRALPLRQDGRGSRAGTVRRAAHEREHGAAAAHRGATRPDHARRQAAPAAGLERVRACGARPGPLAEE